MATNSIKSQFSLRYDTYANWVEKDPVLLAGELAVVVVPPATGAVAKEPTILFKTGDGSSKFNQLQFVAGLAADVYDWAKSESKPVYSVDEITGLSEYVSGKPGEKCEGKTFNIPTGETDADGNAIYEEKTAGIGTERFNVYEDASFEWNGVTRTFRPCRPIGRFISARGTGNISRGLLEDVCGADNKTGENDIGTRQSGCANYAESYFGSQDGCGGTLTGKYGRTSGAYNRARGYACEARGRYTIADGSHGDTKGRPQETFGQFNIPDGTQKYIAIAGNGVDDAHRSNAYMLDYDGNGYFAGNVKIGGTPTDDNDAATKAYVDAHSGSSKQDDWNQNDTTAADYIKNRPGAYMGDETIYDGTLTTELVSGSYRVTLTNAFTLTAGNAYRVTFNGTTYVLTAQDKTAEVNAIILGELTSDNKRDFTNYPFCIYQMEQYARLWTEAAGTYTLKIESLGTVVVPLDSRFMPAGYATEEYVKVYVDSHSGSSEQDDWNQNDTTAADYIKNRPGAYMGDETIYDGTPTTALASGSNRVMLSPAFTLTAGNAYRVTFNGTAYVLIAQDKTAEANAIILGELTSDNKHDFTNYPFLILQMGQYAGLITETAGTHTLKIESLGTVVVPLDSRFMPAGYATEAFVTNAIAGYATEEFVTNAINAALYVDSQTEVG